MTATVLVVVAAVVTVLVALRVWERVMAVRRQERVAEREAQLETERLTIERQRLLALRGQSTEQVAQGAVVSGTAPQIDTGVAAALRIPPPSPPAELRDALAAGECVLFAGSGLATLAGRPALVDLLGSVIDRAEDLFPHALWGSVRMRLEAEEHSVVAEFVRAQVGDERFEEMLRDAVSDADPSDLSALRRLAEIPFSGAVTVDWSGAVGRSLAPPGVKPVPAEGVDVAIDAFRDGEYFVLNAAGDIRVGAPSVTVEDMRRLAVANREYARFIVSLLTTRSLLFLGSSIVGVEEFLDCFPVRRIDSRRHWALVPWDPEIMLEKERFQRVHQVELLPCPIGEDDTAAVERFTRELLGASRPRRRRRGRQVEPERLTGLRLQNIGPFPELLLDLDDHTILLGDNGSGKSSVLRAIALALTGDSADEGMAERLLRTSAQAGEVELITDRGTYRSRLLREGKRRVRIETDGLSPIQASGWLALGFPPLRGISLTNPRGPTGEIADEPTPDDLLPLLSNGPDQRLDGLKQWVVNTAMRAEESSPRSDRDAEMLERFFLVLRELTPGTEFTYRGVDRQTWEVRLDSPDGPLSFDLLSRGMTAVMGWVGILLQRLYEVYGNRDGRPEEQRALVLVDEIDVHMHPEWQQQMLPLVARHFPHVQLIVTTHSPLIVGNARAGEVRVLSRVDNVPTVRKLANRFSGWRSDQILTSPAFEMESTRDTETADKHREYRDLLAHGETPEVNERAAQLHRELEAEMPAEQETPAAREAVVLFRRWLQEQFASQPPTEQEAIVCEAERYLNRLYSGEDK